MNFKKLPCGCWVTVPGGAVTERCPDHLKEQPTPTPQHQRPAPEPPTRTYPHDPPRAWICLECGVDADNCQCPVWCDNCRKLAPNETSQYAEHFGMVCAACVEKPAVLRKLRRVGWTP